MNVYAIIRLTLMGTRRLGLWNVRREPYLLTAISIILLAVSSCGKSPERNSVASGGLVPKYHSFDLGDVRSDKAGKCSHAFPLQNTSDRPIKVTQISTSCGCTAADIANKVIQPGETIYASVTADWLGKSGIQGSMVSIETDHAQSPKIRLSLNAFVTAPAVLDPSTINFGIVEPGQKLTRAVSVQTFADRRPFTVVSVANVSPNVEVVRADAEGKPDTALELEGPPGTFLVSVLGARTDGAEDSIVEFGTDLDDGYSLKLAVTAEYRGAISISPPSMMFGDTSETQTKELSVSIHERFGEPEFSFSPDQEHAIPFRIVEIRKSVKGSNQVYTVQIEFNRGAQEGYFTQAVLNVSAQSITQEVRLVATAG